jgi:V/A-type H+-transporting ATPase subunit K
MIEVTVGQGLAMMGAGLAIGIAGLSAIGQGIAAAGGVGATAEKPEMFGRGLVFAVLPETQAIYGLLIAILILAGIALL